MNANTMREALIQNGMKLAVANGWLPKSLPHAEYISAWALMGEFVDALSQPAQADAQSGEPEQAGGLPHGYEEWEKKAIELGVEYAKAGLGMPAWEIFRDHIKSARAMFSATQPAEQAQSGDGEFIDHHGGDIGVDPISDFHQSALYKMAEGTPHYSALRKLYRLASEFVNLPKQSATAHSGDGERDSYDALWNSLQAIDTAAVMLPTFEIVRDGGIDAVTENIVSAINKAAALLAQDAQAGGEPVAWAWRFHSQNWQVGLEAPWFAERSGYEKRPLVFGDTKPQPAAVPLADGPMDGSNPNPPECDPRA